MSAAIDRHFIGFLSDLPTHVLSTTVKLRQGEIEHGLSRLRQARPEFDARTSASDEGSCDSRFSWRLNTQVTGSRLCDTTTPMGFATVMIFTSMGVRRSRRCMWAMPTPRSPMRFKTFAPIGSRTEAGFSEN